MYNPYKEKCKCKYCGKKFEFYMGVSSPRLISHLIKCHRSKEDQYKNLYISNIIGNCFEFEGGAHD